jgi:hypothetical protein
LVAIRVHARDLRDEPSDVLAIDAARSGDHAAAELHDDAAYARQNLALVFQLHGGRHWSVAAGVVVRVFFDRVPDVLHELPTARARRRRHAVDRDVALGKRLPQGVHVAGSRRQVGLGDDDQLRP